MRADKYSAEPRSQIFAPFKIMHAKSGSSKKLSIRMRNPCNRQLISIHVRLQFFDSSLRGFFAKNRAPLFEEPLRQLRDVFRVLNQVANPNSTHINSMFGLTRIGRIFGLFKRKAQFLRLIRLEFAGENRRIGGMSV